MMVLRLSAVGLAVALASCANPGPAINDNAPTLASLRPQLKAVLPDAPGTQLAVAEEQTIAAYCQLLQATPTAVQRQEAMRRLGDLEMDNADRRAAAANNEVPDYKAAIARYETYLKDYPKEPRNDRVLYQLARALEQNTQLEASLKTLTQLVDQFPGSPYADEAHFRRGEMLFALTSYAAAETAYTAVLQGNQGASANATSLPLRERALYMQGWSRFKQGRLDGNNGALSPFFAVLDLKLAGLSPAVRDEADLANVRSLSRADRELVDDTFRVVSISLSNLQGAASIAPYIDSPARQTYQFRAYQQLAELYLRQERFKDAADTFATFVQREPLHAQAPLLQARVIEIYEKTGFDNLALVAKKDHVKSFGAGSAFRRANPGAWARTQPLVKTHLIELARYQHALAQKSKSAGDVQEAVLAYQELLSAFPSDADAAENGFLLGELLFDDKRFTAAAIEFERVAYGPSLAERAAAQRAGIGPVGSIPKFPRAADAGYSALLSYAALIAAADKSADKAALQNQAVESALRFADAFKTDPRNGAVLSNAADMLLSMGSLEKANSVARQTLALQPPAGPEQRRVAWAVVAQRAFERGEFAQAEQAYGEVTGLTTAPERRADLAERQAAAIYKQGEKAKAAGQTRDAVGHFARAASLANLPAASATGASALVDAAAALVGLKDWPAAINTLQDFRRRYPTHPLQADVPAKLALAYLESGRDAEAAVEFEAVAGAAATTGATDTNLARSALWQAAELHQKTADKAGPGSPPVANALRVWERYAQTYPQPLEPAVQARWNLVTLNQQSGQSANAARWAKAVQEADAQAGAARTPRTRALGGQAALLLAQPLFDAYQRVPLVEPLQQQLKIKQQRMEEVLAAYAQASEVGVLQVTTAATHLTGAVYVDFGKALMGSQRPRNLKPLELEQYNVLLEEQAFPLEEKAIGLFETNAKRTKSGVFDVWVQRSLAELAKLKPVRYAKTERGDNALGTDPALLETLLKNMPRSDVRYGPLLNQLGILYRQQGQFEKARQAYESAMADDPKSGLPVLNLAILFDIYLGEPERALTLYQRCLELLPADAVSLNRWAAEIKGRKS
jgi:cellulose synthase operon protein C